MKSGGTVGITNPLFENGAGNEGVGMKMFL